MSGAEAIFGVVTGAAGLVSLGMQLGESAMKLRRLYQTVKNAPRALNELSGKLDMMVMYLHLLNQHHGREVQPQNWTGAMIAHCITECQQCAQETQQLIDRMQLRMEEHARLRGRLYFAFRDQDIKDLSDRLDKAANSLTMAVTIKSSLAVEYMSHQSEEHNQRQKHILALGEQVLTRLPVAASRGNQALEVHLNGQEVATVAAASTGKKGKPLRVNRARFT